MKDPTADQLLRGVVALAAALREKVIAEGVETRVQAFFLRAAGVDAAQGWLWSKTVPPGELVQLIASSFLRAEAVEVSRGDQEARHLPSRIARQPASARAKPLALRR
jgi:predicted signal transduction protein with EAL and GGDEF domain